MDYKIEVCVDNIESFDNAVSAGANRVELCSALSEGGLTPSYGLIREAVKHSDKIQTMVMIRPRMGDFFYTKAEKRIMLDEVEQVRLLGATGIVVGALNTDGSLDKSFLLDVVDVAGSEMSITFHRAFDVCRDMFEAMELLVQLNFDRILTSGGMRTASEGADTLARLVDASGGRITIMPGCGISPNNILALRERTKATEYHLSARHLRPSLMDYRNRAVYMGVEDQDEYNWYVADPNKIKSIRSLLENK